MTSSSGSSNGGGGGGGGGGDREPEKNKIGSVSKSTGITTVVEAPRSISDTSGGGVDYYKAPASTVAGTGADKNLGGASPYSGSSIGSGVSNPQSLSPTSGGGGGGPVGTTVNQTPAAAAPDGPEGTTITAAPRSDYSVVLAGQVGNRPNRSPSRSNNFVSLVGGAGGLGRATNESKRTLIGGA